MWPYGSGSPMVLRVAQDHCLKLMAGALVPELHIPVASPGVAVMPRDAGASIAAVPNREIVKYCE